MFHTKTSPVTTSNPFTAKPWLAALFACGVAVTPFAGAKEKPTQKQRHRHGGYGRGETTQERLPLRQWKNSSSSWDRATLTLRGVESEGSIGVSVRRDELVEAARLRLTFTLSPALLPGLSHLKVMLNDELLQTVVLNKEQLGTPQTVELDIDPRYFTDYNRFRFQFIGHYTTECENPNHSSLWASVSNDSTLSLSLRQLPAPARRSGFVARTLLMRATTARFSWLLCTPSSRTWQC